jgi:hypothetical protein
VSFILYQVDTAGKKMPGSQTDWKGIVSGSSIGSLTLKGGTDTNYPIGSIIEAGPTAAWADDMVDGELTHANQDGTLKAGAVYAATVLASDVVETAKLKDDNVTDAKLIYGKIRSRQGGSATDWTSPGTNTYDYSATNTFTQCGAKIVTGATGTFITFPTAFSQKPLVFVSMLTAATQNVWARVRSVSTTQCEVGIMTDTTTGGTSEVVAWMAIGQ